MARRKLLKKAFEIMMSKKNIIKLSEAGKKFLDQPIQHPHSEGNFGDSWQEEPDLTLKEKKWRIKSVSIYGELDIEVIDKEGYIERAINSCPLEYFIFEETKII